MFPFYCIYIALLLIIKNDAAMSRSIWTKNNYNASQNQNLFRSTTFNYGLGVTGVSFCPCHRPIDWLLWKGEINWEECCDDNDVEFACNLKKRNE